MMDNLGRRFAGARFLVSLAFAGALAVAPIAPLGATTPTGTEHLLHGFAGASGDGTQPNSIPVFVGTNTLYLTTPNGGKYGDGTVVELTRASGAWPEKVIYSFTDAADGATPQGGVVADRYGSLYGTTTVSSGYPGTVFKLMPSGSTWKLTTLFTFPTTDKDVYGAYPQGPLVVTSSGVLYGTTVYGGGGSCSNGCGTIFELTPVVTKTATTYVQTVLHRFTGGNDGAEPYGGLIVDKSGALYGTTSAGGAYGQGIAYKIVPPAAGKTAWTEYPLHYFTGGSDGGTPKCRLLGDDSGNLFGTTSSGGNNGNGSVFRLAPVSGSTTKYVYRLLHLFTGYPSDGGSPPAGVVLGAGGVIYGVTQEGGSSDNGTVFEMIPTSSTTGVWPEYILYDFSLESGYGFDPSGGIVRDSSTGDLIGTTIEGYSNLVYGTVYEVVPS